MTTCFTQDLVLHMSSFMQNTMQVTIIVGFRTQRHELAEEPTALQNAKYPQSKGDLFSVLFKIVNI